MRILRLSGLRFLESSDFRFDDFALGGYFPQAESSISIELKLMRSAFG